MTTAPAPGPAKWDPDRQSYDEFVNDAVRDRIGTMIDEELKKRATADGITVDELVGRMRDN